MGGVEARVEGGQKRVVHLGQRPRLRPHVPHLSAAALVVVVVDRNYGLGDVPLESVEVDDLQGKFGGRVVVVVEAVEAAVEDASEVAGAERTEEAEVVEVKSAVRGEVGSGSEGRPVRVGSVVRERIEGKGRGGGGVREGG